MTLQNHCSNPALNDDSPFVSRNDDNWRWHLANLPELRAKIWRYAFEPRVISILPRITTQDPFAIERHWKIQVESVRVALLQVCHEIRTLGLQRYVNLGFDDYPIYAKLTDDIIFFEYENNSNLHPAIILGSKLDRVQHFAIDFKCCGLDADAYVFLRNLPQLRKLSFVFNPRVLL
jgi:2EXR family